MTIRKKILIRILLFVAQLVNDDVAFSEELENLTRHVNLYV